MTKKYFSRINAILIVCVALIYSCASKQNAADPSVAAWKNMKQIVDGIHTPVFQNKTYLITNYGAKADGIFDNTQAFKNTIQVCSENGGGIVEVPAGKYFTGPIFLDNNINLHLDEGAEIIFSTNPAAYPIVLTSFEGTEVMNYSPLVSAYQKNNVAITGKGTLNGQGNNENWWPWAGKTEYGWKKAMPIQNVAKLMEMAEAGVPVAERVFGEGFYLRPNFIEFFECNTVMLKDIKIINAPFWILHPMKSTNVIIDGVTITSHGPNNDGCDPEYSKNVIIRNCNFNTGDDCIAIKSGRDADGRRVGITSENIIVQNCKMFDGHGGVTIGSEISAGVRNVFVENCEMDSPELDRAFRIKTNTKRGGFVENLFVRNCTIGEIKESVLGIDLYYGVHGNQSGNFMPRIENLYFENVSVKNGGKYGILAKGHKGFPIKNIVFKNVTIEKVKSKYSIENVENLNFINTKINGELVDSPTK